MKFTKVQAFLLEMKEKGLGIEKLDMRFAPWFRASGKPLRVRLPDGSIRTGEVDARVFGTDGLYFAIETPPTWHRLGGGCRILPSEAELDEVLALGDKTEADWVDVEPDDPKKAYWQAVMNARMAVLDAMGGSVPHDQAELLDRFAKKCVMGGNLDLRKWPADSVRDQWVGFRDIYVEPLSFAPIVASPPDTNWVTPELVPYYQRVKSIDTTLEECGLLPAFVQRLKDFPGDPFVSVDIPTGWIQWISFHFVEDVDLGSLHESLIGPALQIQAPRWTGAHWSFPDSTGTPDQGPRLTELEYANFVRLRWLVGYPGVPSAGALAALVQYLRKSNPVGTSLSLIIDVWKISGSKKGPEDGDVSMMVFDAQDGEWQPLASSGAASVDADWKAEIPDEKVSTISSKSAESDPPVPRGGRLINL